MNTPPAASETTGIILAVDDNAADLALIERVLTKNGYTVHTTSNCDDALRFMRDTVPKLLIFDVDMPGMTGYELATILKKNNRLKDVPIVFLSGDESRSNFKTWREAGGVFYVPKSSDLKNLLTVVRVLMAPRSGSTAPEAPTSSPPAKTSTMPMDAGSRFANRRAAPRYRFSAAAEVFEPISGIRVTGQTCDISASGCYVEIAEPLAPKSAVQLRIAKEGVTFEAWASVVHSEPGRGMGVAFLTVAPKQNNLLAGWIGKLSAAEHSADAMKGQPVTH